MIAHITTDASYNSWRRHASLLAALLLAGCTPGFLSESGPTRTSILSGASQILHSTRPDSQVRYRIIVVNDAVLERMAQIDVPPLPDRVDHPAYHGEIGIGDIIALTVFESGSGGLFLPHEPGTHAGNDVAFPNQQVDHNGNITVPYAGEVHAAGLLPAELGAKIQALLSARAMEPQVLVTIAERRADPVSVLGDVGKPVSFALDPAGISLLAAVAKAEGPRYPAYETVVTLQRDSQLWRVRLSDIAENPSLNRWLSPGDTLYVSHEQRYFVAMGAIGQSGSLGPVDRRLPFQDSDLTLMDALGRAGGLNDGLANPGAIFVYRLEPYSDAYPPPGKVAAPASPGLIPTIYLIDLNDPAGFFYASRFPVRGEDVVYVANAPATDLQKVLTLMIGASATAASIRNTVEGIP
jgi:polysaccharide biosynthesis/export protein